MVLYRETLYCLHMYKEIKAMIMKVKNHIYSSHSVKVIWIMIGWSIFVSRKKFWINGNSFKDNVAFMGAK